jgi:translation initiation factor IF-2
VKSDYKPTALEVITPQREYKNPFASPEPENAPAAEPAKVEIPEAPAAAAAVEPEAPAAPEAPAPAEPEAVRSEIQILPPAEAVRPSVSWESPSAARTEPEAGEGQDRMQRDERPTFRADRREDSGSGAPSENREPRRESFGREPRQPRDPRYARQPRDPRDERQPRDPREARQPRDPRDERPRRDQNGPIGNPAPAAKPASGGFFGWLKRLFGGAKPVETPVERDLGGERFNDGNRPRRRHRGGRGHGGNYQGYQGDRPSQGSPRPEGYQGGEGENRGGDRFGGPQRRRHRGGRGRDRGGDPHSEGHQGGGAI